MTRKETQIKLVRLLLLSGKTITSKQAFQLGITRLADVIYKLRHEHGMPIESVLHPIKYDSGHSKYAEYKMDKSLFDAMSSIPLFNALKEIGLELDYIKHKFYLFLGHNDCVSFESMDELDQNVRAMLKKADDYLWSEHYNKLNILSNE